MDRGSQRRSKPKPRARRTSTGRVKIKLEGHIGHGYRTRFSASARHASLIDSIRAHARSKRRSVYAQARATYRRLLVLRLFNRSRNPSLAAIYDADAKFVKTRYKIGARQGRGQSKTLVYNSLTKRYALLGGGVNSVLGYRGGRNHLVRGPTQVKAALQRLRREKYTRAPTSKVHRAGSGGVYVS